MKTHQLSALEFLLKNEDPENHEPEALWYHNDNAWLRDRFDVKSNSSETNSHNHQRSRGSIIADDMGLGKTLTTLAFILATINKGKSFRD
ncbi:hypothetical protein PTTG_30896, partial [Puccinia triticina 1-1 BBBD Race 1]